MGRLAHDTAEFVLCANQHIRALNFIDTISGLVENISDSVAHL